MAERGGGKDGNRRVAALSSKRRREKECRSKGSETAEVVDREVDKGDVLAIESVNNGRGGNASRGAATVKLGFGTVHVGLKKSIGRLGKIWMGYIVKNHVGTRNLFLC
jgi:hypothetical protein